MRLGGDAPNFVFSNVVRNRIRCQASDNDVDNAVFKAYGIDSTEQSFILTHKKVNR